MAGVAAGVVGAADVNGPTGNPSSRFDFSSPALWSAVWFTASVVYLVGIYIGMFRIGRR